MGEFSSVLKELMEDERFPKSVKFSLEKYMKRINCDEELRSLVVDILEQASNDPNIHPSSRTQLWEIMSIIENIR